MSNSNDAKLDISAEDYLALMDLFARYAWTIDTGDLDGVVALFTEDSWIADPPQGRLEGKEGVRKFLGTVINRPIHRNRQHLVLQRLIRGGPDRCEIVSYWLVAELKSETADTARRGYYTDDCVKVEGEWRFVSRHVRYWTPGSMPWYAD